MASSASDLFPGDATSDSDSDGVPGDGAVEYYRPVSTAADDSDDSDHDISEAPAPAAPASSNGVSTHHLNGGCGAGSNQCRTIPNGIIGTNGGIHISSLFYGAPQNGISALHLSDDEEEEEKEQEREAEIRRAFREDEMRRAAPLTPENASRVMEAMRGIPFVGVPPDWAARVGEESWTGQLRRIRGGSDREGDA